MVGEENAGAGGDLLNSKCHSERNEVKDLEYIHFNTPTSGTQILRDAQDDTIIG